jgi:uncharacterized delta-60 repeat protein/uncharacterized repeat protein (TIGR02543 family)
MQHQKIMSKKFNRFFFLFVTGAVVMLLAVTSVPGWAVPGDLDISFSNDGYDIPGLTDATARAVVIDNSGRSIVVGSVLGVDEYNFLVIRYNSDGTLDDTFDGDTAMGNGIVETDVSPTYNDAAYAVAIQSDGKIVVAGETNNFGGSDSVLVRYNTDGTLDTTFGGSGIVTTDVSGTSEGDGFNSVAIYPGTAPKAGYIVAGGYADSVSEGYNFAMAQYDTTGTLDGGFDSDGRFTQSLTTYDDQINALAIDSSNRIVVAGDSDSDPKFTVCRYDDTGMFDPVFNSPGAPKTSNLASVTLTDESAMALAIQSDGKILVAGYAQNSGGDYDVAVLRLLSDGSDLDTGTGGFAGGTGYAMTDIGGLSRNDYGYAMTLESGGDIFVGGYQNNGVPSWNDFAILKYDTNGVLDGTFGSGGVTVTNLGGLNNEDEIHGMALQSDGKVVVAGKSEQDVAVARYAVADEYYVDISVPDNSGDGSIGDPWKTLHYAFGTVADNAVIYVQTGNYNTDNGEDPSPLIINKNGLKVYAFGTVVIESVTASPWMTGIQIDADQVILKGLEIGNFVSAGIQINGSDNVVDNCILHNNFGYGISIGFTASSNKIINDCKIFQNQMGGVEIDNSPDNLIQNNGASIYDNGATSGVGILIFGNGATNNDIFNTHIYDDPLTTVHVQDEGIIISDVGANSQIDIEGCLIERHGINGIQVYASDARIKRNTFIGNGNALYLAPGLNTVNPEIWNNLMIPGSGSMNIGISVMMDPSSILNGSIFHNTIYGSSGNGIDIQAISGTVNLLIRYNIIGNSGSYGIYNDGPTLTTLGYNNVYDFGSGGGAFYQCTDNGTNPSDDPLFVSNGTDFNLTSVSPCIDVIPVPAADPVGNDIENKARPFDVAGVDNAISPDINGVYDIGCYEFSTLSSGISFAIPDTGQSTCYDNSNIITCPASDALPFFGQDSQYQPQRPRSYTKLGAGGAELSDTATQPAWLMTRDNVTGLIWEIKQDKDGSAVPSNPSDADNTYDWNLAHTDFILNMNGTNFGGFNDWRFPTVKELATLVDSGISGSVIDSTWFPNMDSYYWTNTDYLAAANGAWGVGFDNGKAYFDTKTNAHYVISVREGPAGGPAAGIFADVIESGRMVDNGNGTVTDTFTGLMWQQETDPASPCNWEDALANAEGLVLAGHDDWRLPNRNELQTIVDYTQTYPAINTTVFPPTVSYYYWTSTTDDGNPTLAWRINFDDGGIDGGQTGIDFKTQNRPFRSVRGGQFSSSGELVIAGPVPGDKFAISDTLKIDWDAGLFDIDVRILLSRDGGGIFEELIASTPNNGSASWPIAGEATVNAVLRIEDEADSAIYSEVGFFSLGGVVNLFVTKTGSGSGTVTSIPAGIDCGTTCVGVFSAATMIDLSAAPDEGSLFSGWSGGTGSAAGCSGTGGCLFSITETSSLTADFGLNPVSPGIYYVESAAGSDTNDGQSDASAWQTLHHAIEQINSGPAGTYTLNVAGGVYTSVTNAGFETDTVMMITQSDLTIQGAGIGNTIIDGTAGGFWIDGLDIHNASRMTIADIEIIGFAANGIHMGGAADCIVEACSMHDNVGSGMMIEDNGDAIPVPSSNNIVRNGCEIFNNGVSGVSIRDGIGNQIINNIGSIYDNGESLTPGIGVYIFGSVSENNSVANNHIYFSDTDPNHLQGTGVRFEGVGTGNQVNGNTVYGHNESGIEVMNSDAAVEQNILFDNAQGIRVLCEPAGNADPEIVNNLIYDGPSSNMNYGIFLQVNGAGGDVSPSIYHNTIDGGAIDGIYIYALDGTASPRIEFNVISNFDAYGINNDGGYGAPSNDFNDAWNNASGNYNFCTAGPQSISVPPVYVDDATGDYHLQSTSECIDAIPVPTLAPYHPVDFDLEGVARPQGTAYDTGCYEAVPAPVTHPVQPIYYTVSFVANVGGSIRGNTSQQVQSGRNCTSVTAVADSGYIFTGWSGGASGTTNPLTVASVYSNMTITANFKADETFTVTFTAGAGGNISGSSAQSIVHGENCSPVTAVAAEGYEFVRWSGNYTGTDNPLTITNVTFDQYIMATFQVKIPEIVVVPGTAGSTAGNVEQSVDRGSRTITLLAVPEEGYHFTFWSGDYTGTENPLVLTSVTSDLEIISNFEINTYQVSFNASMGGYISGESLQMVEHGSSSSPVTATADRGYEFAGWTGDANSSASSLTLENVTSDMSLTASFAVNHPANNPELISPIENAVVAPGLVTLTAGGYYDPEGDAHIESKWQIRRSGESDPFYSVASSSDLALHVTGNVLEEGLRYEWRVGYVDAGSQDIAWSGQGSFIAGTTVEDENVPAIPPGFEMKDFRLMSFRQWPVDFSFLNILDTTTAVDTTAEEFKIGTYNPMTGMYEQYPDLAIEPGRAYWVLARYGMKLSMKGVFVSPDQDFIFKLLYDEETGNGWNMIGGPNGAEYLWHDLEIVEYDDLGNVIYGPMPISMLAEDNEYIDKHIWRWLEGGYTSDNSDSFVINPYGGVWVRVKKENIALIFPVSAQSGFLAKAALKGKEFIGGLFNQISPAYAGFVSNDSPPMPMGFSDAGSGSDPGCFIRVISSDGNGK